MDKNIRIKIALNCDLIDAYHYSLTCSKFYHEIFCNNDFWRMRLLKDFNFISLDKNLKELYITMYNKIRDFKKSYQCLCIIGKTFAGQSGLTIMKTANGATLSRAYIEELFYKSTPEYGLEIYDPNILLELQKNLLNIMIDVNYEDRSLLLLENLIKFD